MGSRVRVILAGDIFFLLEASQTIQRVRLSVFTKREWYKRVVYVIYIHLLQVQFILYRT